LFLFVCLFVFEATVNRIVFLISFSACSLLVYRKATDFCMLILYPAMLSKDLQVFWWGLLSIHSYHLHIGIIWLLLSLFESFLFLSLVLLLCSSTMLNKSGESKQPCFVPDFRRNGFSFSPFGMMLAVGLSHSFYSYFLQSFYHERMLNFFKSFFCIYWDNLVIFVLDSVYVVYYIYWFMYVELSLHPKN
jgi:hypothetical protein